MVIPPTIEVANLGMADSLILMVMALVVFGPRRLPQIGRQIGKLMYEFRKASNDFKFQMEEELRNSEEADRRKKEEEERQRQLAANPPAQLEAGAATETPAPPRLRPPKRPIPTAAPTTKSLRPAPTPHLTFPQSSLPPPASRSPRPSPSPIPSPIPQPKWSKSRRLQHPWQLPNRLPTANDATLNVTASEVTNSTTEPAHNG